MPFIIGGTKIEFLQQVDPGRLIQIWLLQYMFDCIAKLTEYIITLWVVQTPQQTILIPVDIQQAYSFFKGLHCQFHNFGTKLCWLNASSA